MIPDPGVELSSPAAGSDTADTTPRFVATAAGAGASDTVTLRLYAGTSAAGSPLTTIALARAGDTWSGEPGAGLGDGTYTAQAERVGAGKAVKSAAVTFRVDTTAPQVSLSTPGIGGSTSDSSPVFTGSAGSAAGDSLQVRAFVYSGLTDTGTPVGTFTGNRSGASFAFKAGSTLPVGTYTARAEQVDAAGNTGRSTARTFAVTSTAPAADLRDTMMADTPRAYWRLGEAGGTAAADRRRSRTPAPTSGVWLWARPAWCPRPEHRDCARRRRRHGARAQLRQSQPDGGAVARGVDQAVRASVHHRHARAEGPSVPAADQLQRRGHVPALARRHLLRAVHPGRRGHGGCLVPRRRHLRRRHDGDLRERHGARARLP